jgi:hypothetical protein
MNATPTRKTRRAPWLALVLACLVGALILAASSHIGVAVAVLGGLAATRLV